MVPSPFHSPISSFESSRSFRELPASSPSYTKDFTSGSELLYSVFRSRSTKRLSTTPPAPPTPWTRAAGPDGAASATTTTATIPPPTRRDLTGRHMTNVLRTDLGDRD